MAETATALRTRRLKELEEKLAREKAEALETLLAAIPADGSLQEYRELLEKDLADATAIRKNEAETSRLA